METSPRPPSSDRPSDAAGNPVGPVPPAARSPGASALGRGWHQTFGSLESRGYRFLWLGLVFWMGASQMQMVAVGYLTYDLTDSPLLLGLVTSGFAPSMLALSLFGGAIADRIERKRIILLCQAGVCMMYLLIATATALKWVSWHWLLAESVFDGVVFSFMGPARQAIIPQLVGRDKLTNALALNAAAMSAMTLLGPAVAGGLYALLGPQGVFFTTAGMAAIALALTAFVPRPRPDTARRRGSMLADIKAGLTYIARSRLVLALLLLGGATALFAMPFQLMLPVLVVDIYRRGPESLGLLLSIMGLGSLIGALFAANLRPGRRGLIMLLGTLVAGVGLSLVATFPFYYAGALFMLVVGLGDSARRAILPSLVMEQTEDRYRGRVMSVWMFSFALMPLGALPAGLVAQYLGGRAAAGFLATMVVATALVVLATQPRVRRMP